MNRDRVRQIALRHRMQEVRVFGTVARGEDTEESDLDLLVLPAEHTTLFDIGAIRYEVRQLLGVAVDVLTPEELPPIHRKRILEESEPV